MTRDKDLDEKVEGAFSGRKKEVIVRSLEDRDIDTYVEIYQKSFAEEPWNEFMKCEYCEMPYGEKQINSVADECVSCSKSLRLVEFWPRRQIEDDLRRCRSQDNSVALVAEIEGGVFGILTGHPFSIDAFPFLKGVVKDPAHYLREVAVKRDARAKGIGRSIMNEYLNRVRNMRCSEIVLRTDDRNDASMSLFCRFEFKPIQKDGQTVYDPRIIHRAYLRRSYGGCEEND